MNRHYRRRQVRECATREALQRALESLEARGFVQQQKASGHIRVGHYRFGARSERGPWRVYWQESAHKAAIERAAKNQKARAKSAAVERRVEPDESWVVAELARLRGSAQRRAA
jgi:hypothetical protein